MTVHSTEQCIMHYSAMGSTPGPPYNAVYVMGSTPGPPYNAVYVYCVVWLFMCVVYVGVCAWCRGGRPAGAPQAGVGVLGLACTPSIICVKREIANPNSDLCPT